jgi:5'-deoxynucleotidase YfbR-like HD superfamily hydrolase
MRDDNATIRNAGDVIRYHTRKVIHRQDVANHTWNVMRIYIETFGLPRAEVLAYILYHDVPEIITGDVPFQIKRLLPELKIELRIAEFYAIGKLKYQEYDISTTEKYRVKIADLLEMKEFAEEEIAMGNSTAQDIIENINIVLEEMNWSR